MATERDELTGAETTGHEWDGLKELNNPLPRWWLYILYASIVASVIYSFFVPPIPGVMGVFETKRCLTSAPTEQISEIV